MQLVSVGVAVTTLSVTASITMASPPGFVGTGLLPGSTSSGVARLSADGMSAVGLSQSASALRAFRWTTASGLTELPGMPAIDPFAVARAVSGDGLITVGYSSAIPQLRQAVMWMGPGGPTVLPALSSVVRSEAHGISADGRVIVGFGVEGSSGEFRAVRWADGGVPENLGVLPGGRDSAALDVNADGTVVAGRSENSSGFDRAFRWTSSTGMIDLGTFGGRAGISWAVSDDGAFVVGAAQNSSGIDKAFRWTEAGGLQDLGALPGTVYSEAFDISADGLTIVGTSKQGDFARAVAWLPTTGIVDLNTFLPSIGISLTNWTLTSATSISADGLTLAGMGVHRISGINRFEGWVATIPSPGTLLPAALGACMVSRRRSGRP